MGAPTLRLVSGPTEEPVTRLEAKRHLRLDDGLTADDPLVDGLIRAARERVEAVTGRQLVKATYELVAGGFPRADSLELPRPPLRQVISVTYRDPTGTTRTWETTRYQILAPSGPAAARGRIAPVYGETWPPTQPETLEAVTIRFEAGYGAPAAVPAALKQAILLLLGAWYVRREDDTDPEVPTAAYNLMVPFISRPTQAWC
ncbi:MAG TPA: hypothetical protein VNI83_04640 [Vicinamibacterales bacterium]|nr:hypothetical protein [Vicinamibacterales bacterium]